MLGRLNHVAIAVKDAEKAAKIYGGAFERNADGGIHHICYDVPDIIAARDTLIKEGARVLGDGQPKIGAHGKPVLFFHPKDFSGALVEIEQA
jgi:methylmalonyl-CoA/ethylmalonyl-CoA epimerase